MKASRARAGRLCVVQRLDASRVFGGCLHVLQKCKKKNGFQDALMPWAVAADLNIHHHKKKKKNKTKKNKKNQKHKNTKKKTKPTQKTKKKLKVKLKKKKTKKKKKQKTAQNITPPQPPPHSPPHHTPLKNNKITNVLVLKYYISSYLHVHYLLKTHYLLAETLSAFLIPRTFIII